MKNEEEPQEDNGVWDTYGPIRKVLTLLVSYIYLSVLMGYAFGAIDYEVTRLLRQRGYNRQDLEKFHLRYFYFICEIFQVLLKNKKS